MEEYKKMWRNFANFSGRSTVRDYWMAALMNFVVGFIVGAVAVMVDIAALGTLYAIAVFIPGISLAVRRLHDTNRSGWFYLINLIPLVGFIIFIVLLCMNSVNEGNKYGDIAE